MMNSCILRLDFNCKKSFLVKKVLLNFVKKIFVDDKLREFNIRVSLNDVKSEIENKRIEIGIEYTSINEVLQSLIKQDNCFFGLIYGLNTTKKYELLSKLVKWVEDAKVLDKYLNMKLSRYLGNVQISNIQLLEITEMRETL